MLTYKYSTYHTRGYTICRELSINSEPRHSWHWSACYWIENNDTVWHLWRASPSAGYRHRLVQPFNTARRLYQGKAPCTFNSKGHYLNATHNLYTNERGDRNNAHLRALTHINTHPRTNADTHKTWYTHTHTDARTHADARHNSVYTSNTYKPRRSSTTTRYNQTHFPMCLYFIFPSLGTL